MRNTNRISGAVLLIAGTAIGAGMLALPVTTAEYGFLPSTVLFLLSWLSMTFASLLMLEANLWFHTDANLISMAKETLGKWGEGIAWVAYLLLLYSLMSAYLSGMNSLSLSALGYLFNLHLPPLAGSILLIGLFGAIIYLGATTIDYLNRLLMVGLVVSYFVLVLLISPHVDLEHLKPYRFNHLWLAIPIVITSFGYQIIIPSIRSYLESDIRKIRLAILIGSVIPLVVYLVWEILILGVLPLRGEHGLLTILASGQPATALNKALEKILQNPLIGTITSFFAFYAISTSFIGVSFSLFDFLADGFHIQKTKLGRFFTACVTFIPPLIFALTYPSGFIFALGFAGIFVAVLLMILPALIVISGRYFKKYQSQYRVKGGLISITLLIVFALIVIIAELLPGSPSVV